MTSLGIVMKKVSPTHHAFTMVFEGGGKETVELETKTYLYHDLLHFAVESEAGLSDSFYGRLLKGYRYDELSLPEMPTLASGGDHEGLMTERIVGLMTGVLRHDSGPEEAMHGLDNLLSASGDNIPVWFTADFVLKVKERMRKLEGEWKGTPFGESMTLEFVVQ
jgi:hypothetical protein